MWNQTQADVTGAPRDCEGDSRFSSESAVGPRLRQNRPSTDMDECLCHQNLLLRTFVFFHFAVADADDAVGVRGDVGFVRDQDDGVAAFVQARK